MTACAIASQFGKGFKQPTVEIDGFNSELLSNRKFDSDPLLDLEIYKCRTDEHIENLKRKYKIDQKVKIKIDPFNVNGVLEIYPEKS